MTDKQIIIDGVPVQDCCYFDYENDGYEDSCYIYIKTNVQHRTATSNNSNAKSKHLMRLRNI